MATIAGKRNLSANATLRILLEGEDDPARYKELFSGGRSVDEVRRELLALEGFEGKKGKTAKMRAQRLVDDALGRLGIPRDIGVGIESKK